MKILQINNVYNAGSTGKIVREIHDELIDNGIESIVCYGRGAKSKEKGIFKTCGELYAKFNNVFSRITGMPYGGCRISTRRLLKVIKRENPDIVHIHCINGHFVNIYKLLNWLKEKEYKTVLTLHAEFMYTANCGYHFECDKYISGCGNCPRLKQATGSWFMDSTRKSWQKMKQAFEGFSNLTIVSVSPWEQAQANKSPMLQDKNHAVVLNGVNTQIFNCKRDKFESSTPKTVIHATPYFNADPNYIKGGYFVLILAERMKNIRFLIAGDFDKKIKVPQNVTLLGKISDQNLLAQYYFEADLTLLTSKAETFSMICAESLCCGTPIVGFKAGGPEMISIEDYSSFVEYGDLDALQNSVEEALKSIPDKKEIARQAAIKYSIKSMTNQYMEIYNKLFNE